MSVDQKPIELPNPLPQEEVELFNNTTLPKREIIAWLNRQNLSADAKAFLLDIAALTAKVGQTILNIGRKILTFIAEAVAAYPSTTFGIVVGAVIALLIAAVPFVGPVLASIFGPLIMALGVARGAINDFQTQVANDRLDRIEREFALLKA